MDDIPLTTDWRRLCVVLFDKQLLWAGNSDAVVSSHGWKGAMSFDDACRWEGLRMSDCGLPRIAHRSLAQRDLVTAMVAKSAAGCLLAKV